MASLTKTVEILLNGEDRASKEIRQVNQTMGDLTTRYAGVAKAGGQAAVAIGAVGAAVTALVGAGLKQAYDEAVNFETAMVDLQKVLGDHPEQLDQAKNAAMELSNQYGVSSKEIVDSIANWVQAGYDVQDATTLAEESIALMYSSELEAAEATDTLVKMLKGFKVEVDDTRSKLDAINEVSENYAASVGDMSEALSKVGPVAEAMGFSVEEMTAILTPAIESFQSGKEVGNGFRTVLNKLTDDAKPTQEALETLGVNQRDANGELKSGRDIMFEVGEAFQDLNPSQKTFVAQQIAGQEQSAKFLATMNEWDKVGDVYETAIDSAGSVSEELQAKLASAHEQLKLWDEGWRNLSTVIGIQFKAAATEAVEGGTNIVNALQESVSEGAMDPFFDMLDDLLTDLSDYLGDIGDALPEAMESVDWEPLAQAIGEVGDAVGGIFDDLDLTKPDQLAEALQRIVDRSSDLIAFFGKMVGVLDPVISAFLKLTDYVNTLTDGVSYFANVLEANLTLAIAGVIELLKKFWEALDSLPLTDFGDEIKALENLQTTLNERVEKALDDSNEAADRLRRGVDKIPEEKEFKLEFTEDDKIKQVKDDVDSLPDFKPIEVQTDDKGSTDKTKDEVDGLPEFKPIEVKTDDKGSTEKTKEDIDKIPAEKMLEITADVRQKEIEKDIAEIEAKAETMQSMFEITGEVKMAKIEAETERVTKILEGLGTTIQSTGEAASSMWQTMGEGDLGLSEKWELRDQLEAEADMRKEAHDMQMELAAEELKTVKQRRQSMQEGNAMIQINGEGLQPHLEAFMWEILQEIQVRVNEEGMDMLTGM